MAGPRRTEFDRRGRTTCRPMRNSSATWSRAATKSGEPWKKLEAVSEGFELAEDDLIEHASHGDEISASRILRDAGTLDEEQSDAVYGEADEEGIPGER